MIIKTTKYRLPVAPGRGPRIGLHGKFRNTVLACGRVFGSFGRQQASFSDGNLRQVWAVGGKGSAADECAGARGGGGCGGSGAGCHIVALVLHCPPAHTRSLLTHTRSLLTKRHIVALVLHCPPAVSIVAEVVVVVVGVAAPPQRQRQETTENPTHYTPKPKPYTLNPKT
jgi:hypothetical protein